MAGGGGGGFWLALGSLDLPLVRKLLRCEGRPSFIVRACNVVDFRIRVKHVTQRVPHGPPAWAKEVTPL